MNKQGTPLAYPGHTSKRRKPNEEKLQGEESEHFPQGWKSSAHPPENHETCITRNTAWCTATQEHRMMYMKIKTPHVHRTTRTHAEDTAGAWCPPGIGTQTPLGHGVPNTPAILQGHPPVTAGPPRRAPKAQESSSLGESKIPHPHETAGQR